MKTLRVSEHGFITVLGCCMLMGVLFFGSALAYVARNEMEVLKRYQAEISLYYSARSCMEQAVLLLENQHISDAEEKYSETTCVWEEQFSDKIHVAVHAREKDGAIILMSLAEQEDLWGVPAYQAVYGCMVKEGDCYVWKGWFDQDG